MRAAVLEAPNTPLLVKDLVQDEPQYGEVRVRMGAAGICASDHHIMEGTAAFPLPSVLGHEGAGTIEEVGPGVISLKPGDRCILSFVTPCGQCPTCRRGQPQLCDLHQATGSRLLDGTVRLHDDSGREIYQMGKLGVFGEHVVTAQQACFPIPDQVPMEVAALIGLLGDDRRRRSDQSADRAGRDDGGRDWRRRRRTERDPGRENAQREQDHRGRHPRPQTRVCQEVRRDRHGQRPQRQRCRRGGGALQWRRRLRLRHVRLRRHREPGLRVAWARAAPA